MCKYLPCLIKIEIIIIMVTFSFYLGVHSALGDEDVDCTSTTVPLHET